MPLSIAMIDVNGLKLTNDAFGHRVGDALLKKVSEVLTLQIRKKDILARIGGDEFVILMPNTLFEEAQNIIDSIYEAVRKECVEKVVLSISVGLQTKNQISERWEEIFSKAEAHMYRKKLTEGQSMRNRTIKIILDTLKEKNPWEEEHAENVKEIGLKIGKMLGLNYKELRDLEVAAQLHDIGKISVNQNILMKEKTLTAEEYEEIKKHSENGYQILKLADMYNRFSEYILYHHERWDGKGYPKQLKKTEIPLISRIIGVAETIDFMSRDKSYQKKRTKEEIVEELKRQSGYQFDPNVIACILENEDNMNIIFD